MELSCYTHVLNAHILLIIDTYLQGVTASYFGISETVIHFVIYEHIKKLLRENEKRNHLGDYMVRYPITRYDATPELSFPQPSSEQTH